MIKLRILRCKDYPGLSRWATNVSTGALEEESRRVRVREQSEKEGVTMEAEVPAM